MSKEPHHYSADEARRSHLEHTIDVDTVAKTSGSLIPPLDPFATIEPTSAQECSGRFVVLRPLNRGNLGVVSVALDQELNREIALKHIRDDRADSELYRQSFVREAEVTGKLEHPGVVPVYSFGKDAKDRLFYAMRLIRGIDLRTAIQLFHKGVSAKQIAYDGAQLRELVRNLVSVCHTMAYAHARGVIHRDLKPANIMLGPYGETLVVDWGLAKPTGVASGAQENGQRTAHDLSGAEMPLEMTKSNTSNTMDGSIIGSPVYAPIEQLTGNLAAIDHRSDIYSLGAILFEILTGGPPLGNTSLIELIATVKAGLIPAPRDVLPQVPKAISAVCRRAMQTNPSDRYQSVQDLRKDLESWLYDLPVAAYQESAWERGLRWMRTHQSIVRASVVCLILIACVSTIAAMFIDNARRNQAIALKNEAAARREATDLYRLARSTAETLLTTTSDRLAEIPDAIDLRQELLVGAATAYEKMAENHSADPGLKREAASSLLGLAAVQRKLDLLPASSTSLKKAVSKLDELLGSPEANDRDSLDLAKCLIELGRVYSDERRDQEASRSVVRALALLDPSVTSSTASAESWLLRGEALIQKAIIEQDRGDQLAAIETNQAAVDALRSGLERVSDSALTVNLRHQLARGLLNLAFSRSTRDPTDARIQTALEDSLENLEWCVAHQPNRSAFSQDLALVHNNLADCLLNDQGNLEEALKFYNRSLEFFSKLAREQPLVAEYKNGLILAQLGLGNVAYLQQDRNTAQRHYHMADTVADQLLAQNSLRSTFRATCALAKFTFGEVLTDSEPDKAIALLEYAAKLLPKIDRDAAKISLAIDQVDISMQRDLAQLSRAQKLLLIEEPTGLAERLPEFVQATEPLKSWKAAYNSACYISLACTKLRDDANLADELASAVQAAMRRLARVLSERPEQWETALVDPDLELLRENYAAEFQALKPGPSPKPAERT